MTYFGYALWAAVGVGLAVVAWQARCWAGVHPRQELRMLSGRQYMKRPHGGVASWESVAEWQCGRCMRIVGETVVQPNVSLHRELRKQVLEARERSKVLNFEVVRKDGVA